MYSFFTVSNLHIILKTELVHLQFYPVISVFRNIKYTCLTLSKLRHILTFYCQQFTYHFQFYPVISVFRNIKYTCLTLSKLRHILTSTSSGYGSPLRVYYVSEVIKRSLYACMIDRRISDFPVFSTVPDLSRPDYFLNPAPASLFREKG